MSMFHLHFFLEMCFPNPVIFIHTNTSKMFSILKRNQQYACKIFHVAQTYRFTRNLFTIIMQIYFQNIKTFVKCLHEKYLRD